jgi:hypothetical protein
MVIDNPDCLNSSRYLLIYAAKEPVKFKPAEKLTTDISKLTDQDRKDIAARISTGNATAQDRIYSGQMIREGILNKQFASKDPLVTDLAVSLEMKFPGLIKEIEKIIKDPLTGKTITDFDIVTNKQLIIEVTVGGGKGKVEQIVGRQIPNAEGKEVVLFGPNVGGAVEKNLKANGIKLFRNENDLANYIKNKR